MSDSAGNGRGAVLRGAKAVCIAGTGSYLPERVLTNVELEKMVDTTDEWIRTRTGISERRIAAEDEATSDMAAVAATRALEDAGVAAADVDVLMVATVTPDVIFPSTACLVQERIGAKNAFCFDIGAACSGFLYGLELARSMILSGLWRNVLLVCAEKFSAFTDWSDRSTCILFGDGAGAVLVRASENGRGIVDSVMGSDGALSGLLGIPGGGSRLPTSSRTIEERQHFVKMAGNEVFKYAVRGMSDASQQVLKKCGLTVGDISWIIPHQANIRIIKAISARLGNVDDKFYMNLDRVGNMSAASIPVALDEAVRNGSVKKGDTLLFVAFGGGFTWGATVVDW